MCKLLKEADVTNFILRFMSKGSAYHVTKKFVYGITKF